MCRKTLCWLVAAVCAVYPVRFFAQAGMEVASVVTGGVAPLMTANTKNADSAPIELGAVSTTLHVNADSPEDLDALGPVPTIIQAEILSSAGTYGDFSRYLQALPGVIGNSDMSNEVLVRGGHPTENLFVVDGVEVPNINHFSLSGSNGGFTSMIDSTAVGSMSLRDDVYGAGYSSRLSSLIEVHTRELGPERHVGNVSAGISGVGGLYQRALAHNGNILLSGHRSILNLVTNDIGINGVPTYTNGMAHADFKPTDRDNLSFFSLTGADSIDLTPCQAHEATSIFQTQYAGWRTTEGFSWGHTFSPRVTGDLTASTSLTRQNIGQQQQVGISLVNGVCEAASLTPAYIENSLNGLSALKYVLRADTHGWLISAGTSGNLTRANDSVAQPNGQLSPYSADASRSDAVTFQRNFATGQSATFVEAERTRGTRWTLEAGLRAETFAINTSYALDPRVSLAYRINNRQTLHGSVNLSSQLPPFMDMISYAGNHSLRRVQARQETFGIRLWQANWGTLDTESYWKSYRHESVSTEYPALMLSNLIDTLGQGFAWLPLTSAGTAQDRGLELVLRAHWKSRMQGMFSFARSQSTYRALDGIRRSGNYDTPLVANATGNFRLPLGIQLNLRETISSGRLYTPFDLTDSNAQSRGIYDLTRINTLRGPIYNRLDAELERSFHFEKATLNIQAGAQNALNRGNLLGYVWLDNCSQGASCADSSGEPITKVDQIGRYPVFSARYEF